MPLSQRCAAFLSIAAALSALVPVMGIAQNPSPAAEVGFLVEEQVAATGHADVLAIFDGLPDLSGANALATKEEKARYVHEALRQNARRHAPLLAELQRRGVNAADLWIANAVHVPRADRATVTLLSRTAGVAQVAAVQGWQIDDLERDATPLPDDKLNARDSEPTWGIRDIGADQVWDLGIRGEGAVVAGGDTGYDWTHPALQRRYRGTVAADGDTAAVTHDYHWYDGVREAFPGTNDANPCGFGVGYPCDDGRHGTHTMGTMVGRAGDSIQIGVAPEASWIACRNMDRGNGTPTSYLNCFQFFLAPTDLQGENPRPELAPDVIANSWYCPESEGCFVETYPAFNNAVEALRAAGTVVIASAGNAGRNGCNTISEIPARVPGAFAVGAHAESGEIAAFSSRGSYERDSLRIRPDLTMPGVGVRSSTPPDDYTLLSGTSMASPHAAGVVALMISANPQLRGQVDTIEAMLRRSARPTAVTSAPGADATDCSPPGQEVPNNVFGYGRGSAIRAVESALAYAGVVSTEEARAVDFALVPNPATDLVTVRLPAEAASASIVVTDVTGRTVAARREFAASASFDVGDWAAGLYVVTVRTEAGSATERLLVR